MVIAGRVVGRVDARLLIGLGFALAAVSLWMMTRFSLQMNGSPVFWSGLVQGTRTGIAFVPLSALTFATLSVTLPQ